MGPFFGRERELADLLALSDPVTAGHPSIALIAGEPGIGKTRLAEECTERLAGRGFAAARGRSWAGDGAPPFWPWVQTFRSLGADDPFGTTHSPGVTSTGDAAATRFLLFDHVVEQLAERTADRPAVAVLDDLHWADEPSLLLLRFLANDTRPLRLLVVGTYRPAEVEPGGALGTALADLNRVALRIELSGLSREATSALVVATTGAEPRPEMSDAVHRRTGGNPFFVRELARLLDSQGRLGGSGSDPPGGVAELSVPEGVREVIERRVARLAQSTESVLGAAAVLGQEFDIATLRSMFDDHGGDAGQGARPDVLAAIDEAAAARLIEPDEATGAGRYRFAHALVRDALYADLPAGVRTDLHRRAADGIRGQTGEAPAERVAELAEHCLRAVPAIDPLVAAGFLEQAGRRAVSQMAYEEATRLFSQALMVMEQARDAGGRLRMLLALGDALVRVGDLPSSRTRFEEAADLARRLDRSEDLARAALGVGAGLTGFEIKVFDRRQIDLLEEALDRLAPGDSALRAWLLARLSVALSYAEPPRRREALSRDAVAMARRLDERVALAYALSSLCDAIAGPDHVVERWDAATSMVDLARAAGEPEMELLGRRFRVVALLEQGRIGEADQEIDAFARLATPLRQALYLWYVPVWRAMRALVRGDFDGAEALVVQAEEIGRRASSENAEMLVLTVRFMAAHVRGEHAAVTDLTATSMEQYASYPGAAAALAIADLDRGRPAEARAVARTLALGVAENPRDSEFMASMTYVAEALWATREPGGAERLYDALLPHRDLFAVDGIGAVLVGSVERPLALLAALLGRRADAEEHFAKATEAHRRIEAAPLLAQTEADHADALVRLAGEDGSVVPPRAMELARSAAAVFRTIGAPAKADAALRAAGPADEAKIEPFPDASGELIRDGDVWNVTWGGRSTRLRDAKGLRDLAVLLARPGVAVHVMELAGGAAAAATGGQDVLDTRARDAYRERLRALGADLEEAEANHDPERAARIRIEVDALTEQLVTAFGLGGRPRAMGDSVERARKAVTARIRESVRRIERDLPALGRHLDRSIRTGAFCSYDPAEPVRWSVRP